MGEQYKMSGCDQKLCEEIQDRLREVEHNDVRFAEALEGIKKNTDELLSVARQQVRLEERQISQGHALDRMFKALEDMSKGFETRIRYLESTAPTNALASKWVFAGVAAAISADGSRLLFVE